MVKKLKKQYETPTEGWNEDRIEREKELIDEYGLRNKQEVYRTQSRLRDLRRQARELIGTQRESQKQQLIEKVLELGLVKEGAGLEGILTLETEDLMDRRLQTAIERRGYAETMLEARQIVTHRMVRVDGKVVDIPGYLLTQVEEKEIEVREPEDAEEGSSPEKSESESNKEGQK